MKRARVALGLAVACIGIALIFMPDQVASVLQRPATNVGEAINLRATWGGSVLGIGAFTAARDALRPWRVTIVAFLVWGCAGIGIARAIGFALDGTPDWKQWLWLILEIVIAAGGAAYLYSQHRSRANVVH